MKYFSLIVFSFLLGLAVVSCSKKNIPAGNIPIPQKRSIQWSNQSAFRDSILGVWASKTVEYGKERGKVHNPRILLARLHLKETLSETNQIILAMKPWGVSGSSWALNKLGDYDFSLTVLTTILWQFGDHPDILYPETVDHLVQKLLIEEGNNFRRSAPRTLGLFPETENHLLMTEGSRYLKNRWITLHGNQNAKYDNIANGMESKLLALLTEMEINGLYEFNSMPYVGYTITALLNLEAYASDKIRDEARAVLDYMNFCYALGSYHYQHFPPIRRRYERANWNELTTDYHSVFFKAWMSFLPEYGNEIHIGQGQAHALMGACMPYRPSDEVIELINNKGKGYFITLGHGKKACPEIYSAGKNYLLSAGGANRGKKSQIVARPITLFTDEVALNLKNVFHLSGPGTDFMKWNNTGVYKRFACAAGPVQIPDVYLPVAQHKNWSVFTPGQNLLLAVFSSKDLGIVAVFEGGDANKILNDVETSNPDIERLKTTFQFPGGSLIEYDVYAPKNKWVITKVDGKLLDREYDAWPLLQGNIE
jgi:hypothetical protein